MRNSREALDDAVFMSDDATLLSQLNLGPRETGQCVSYWNRVVRHTFPAPRWEHRS